MMAKIYLMLVALLLLSIQSFAVAETSDEECSAEFKTAVDDGDNIFLRQVPCLATTAEACGEQRTFFTDCDVCCAPGRKPEPSGCSSFRENRGEGSFCGQILSYAFTTLGYDSCKDDLYCDGDSDSETYLTCVKKPPVEEFDCTEFSEVDLIRSFDCASYLFLGEPRGCNPETKRCEVLPSVGSECSDDDDVAGFRCSDYGMTCDDGKCRFLEEGEKCGSDAEDGLENVSCRTGYECTSSGSSSTTVQALGGKSALFAFGEEPEGDDVQTCVRKLQGGDSCGYPGKSCPGSSYCNGAPNGKEDDPRAGLVDEVLAVVGSSMKRMFLQCGVFCDGKIDKINFTDQPGQDGDCICQKDGDDKKQCRLTGWAAIRAALNLDKTTAALEDPSNFAMLCDQAPGCDIQDSDTWGQVPAFIASKQDPGEILFQLATENPQTVGAFVSMIAPALTAGADRAEIRGLGLDFDYILDEFDGVPLISSSDPCPDNEETEEILEEEWKGKTGSCAAPGFIKEDHNVGDECFTGSGGRVCHNGGQMSGPDTKCNTETTCVDRKLGATAAFKRFGFIEDFDYGDGCDLAEEEEEDLAGRCVCGPKGSSVFKESYAPQDDGTAFWCSAIGVLYERCERSNKCVPSTAVASGIVEQPCSACRSLFEELIVDCWRPKASTIPSRYIYTTYVYGADPNFKNRRFIGAFFGVLIGLILVVTAAVCACKKCRSKSVGDGSKDVVPKEDA